MENIIATHNKSLLNKDLFQTNPTPNKDCNCRQKENCQLSGECQAVGIVYQATLVKREDTRIGINIRRDNHLTSGVSYACHMKQICSD